MTEEQPPLNRAVQFLDGVKWLVLTAFSLIVAGFASAQYLETFQTRAEARDQSDGVAKRIVSLEADVEAQRSEYHVMQMQLLRIELQLRSLRDEAVAQQLPRSSSDRARIEQRIRARDSALSDQQRMQRAARSPGWDVPSAD